jgi:choline dehydrogenase
MERPIDWQYQTEPQKHLANRQISWPRGKVYGGSSAINVMIYQRGHPANYNEWAAMGNEGWGWDDVLPYFIKSENQQNMQSEFHGYEGPLHVSDLPHLNPLSKAFVEAALSVGYAHNSDFNDGDQEGFGFYQVTQKNGRRHSAAAAYLTPVLQRPNLTAVPFAHVLRLIVDGDRCTGVAYRQDGQEIEVAARREVILCAGAVNSPQLLMLSGIGPQEDLAASGIPLVMDLPGVGQNLQDHVNFPLGYHCDQTVPLFASDSKAKLVDSQAEVGNFLSTNWVESGGFLTLTVDSAAPDIQFHFLLQVEDGAIGPDSDVNGFYILPGISKVKSVGSLSLRSADPDEPPTIDPNYLAEEADIQLLLKSFAIAREIAAASPFASYRIQEELPGPAVQGEAEIREFLKEHADTIFHPVGSCKMGHDPLAVVNDRLQVHGIQGLRVADASIMPFIINANTNAACIMIGEKAADLIKEVS